jgi:hypothetical protein
MSGPGASINGVSGRQPVSNTTRNSFERPSPLGAVVLSGS